MNDDSQQGNFNKQLEKEKQRLTIDSDSIEVLLCYFVHIINNKTTADLFSALKKSENQTERIWAEHRTALHDEIVKSFLKGVVSDDKPIALFLGGGSASGKSEIRDEIIVPWLDCSIIVIDCDLIKQKLPEYKLYRKINSVIAANVVHIESTDIANTIISSCIDNNISFIYDTTLAGSPEQYYSIIQQCKQRQYQLILVGVCTPLKVALEREHKRFLETGRKVPKEVVEYTHTYFPITFHKIEPEFDIVHIYDNSEDCKAPTIVAVRQGKGEVLDIYEQKMYDEFKKRGDLHANEE